MSLLTVKVHPYVLFNIVDAFERRHADQKRVIGTLLGTQDKSGNVEVTNCFMVNHREMNKEVSIDIEVAKSLYELYRRVNSNETIVGWFSTGGGEINEYSVIIHDYYSRETPNPIHLTVDPTAQGLNIKAYVSTNFGVPGKTIGTMFSVVPNVQIASGYETELVGLKACMDAAGIKQDEKEVAFDSEVEMILASTKRCQETIDLITSFIDESILSTGKPVPSNCNEMGRELMAMCESLIPFDKNSEDALNTNLKDLLMIIYLSNLTKTQLMLNEKLTLL